MGESTGRPSFGKRLAADFRDARATVRGWRGIRRLRRARLSLDSKVRAAHAALGVRAEAIGLDDERALANVRSARGRLDEADDGLSALREALESARRRLDETTRLHAGRVGEREAELRPLAEADEAAGRDLDTLERAIRNTRDGIGRLQARLAQPPAPGGETPEAVRAEIVRLESQAREFEAALPAARERQAGARTAADAKRAEWKGAKSEADAAISRAEGERREAESAAGAAARGRESAAAALAAAHETLGGELWNRPYLPTELAGPAAEAAAVHDAIAANDREAEAARARLREARGGAVRFCLFGGAVAAALAAVLILALWAAGAIGGRGGDAPVAGPDQAPSPGETRGAGGALPDLPDAAAEHARTPATLSPAPPAESGTPAVDLQPLPELRIAAPANALDKPREFKATRLPEAKRLEIARRLKPAGVAVLSAIDVDAGMGPDDRLQKPLTLSLDLKRLGLKPEHYANARLMRADDQGNLFLMDAELRGDCLTAERHHNATLIGVLVAVGVPLAILSSQYQRTGFQDYFDYEIPHFSLHVSRKIPTRKVDRLQSPAEEKEALLKELQGLWDETMRTPVLSPEGTPREEIEAEQVKRFLDIPRVGEIRAKLAEYGTVKWYKENVWSDDVCEAVDALLRSYQYLVEERKFRKPPDRLDVYLPSPWTHAPNTLAAMQKTLFRSPYIHVNVVREEVYAIRGEEEKAKAEAKAKWSRELPVTLCHELFHVIQLEYYGVSKLVFAPQILATADPNGWLMEATACVLETDIQEDYPKKGWIRGTVDLTMNQKPTGPNWGFYRGTLADSGVGDENPHGYANAHFLLALRDRYYSRNPRAFLPALLDDFGGFRGGAVESLWRTTSNSSKVLGMDFLLFAADKVESIAVGEPRGTIPKSLRITPKEPYARWPLTPTPLGSPCIGADFVDGFSDMEKEAIGATKIVLRSNELIDKSVYTRVRFGEPGKAPWKTLPRGPQVLPFPAAGPGDWKAWGAHLQRVETYANKGDAPSGAATDLFVLAPGAKPPKAEKKGEEMIVEWEPSALVRAIEKAGVSPADSPFKEYQVSVQLPLAARPQTFRTAQTRLTVPIKEEALTPDAETLAKLREALEKHPEARGKTKAISDLSLSDALELGYLALPGGKAPAIRVWIQDVVKGDPEIVGPAGAAAEIPVGGGKAGDVSGVWEGTAIMTDVKFRLTISMDGADIKGVQEQTGEREKIDFDGKWDPSLPGWTLHLYPEGRTRPDGQPGYTMQIGQLRPMPNGKLNMSVPPVTLTKVK